MHKFLPVNLQLLAGDGDSGKPADGAGDQGTASGGTDGQANPDSNKTFTQEQVDAMIAARLERERKKMPPKEDLDAFREWQKTQKPAEGKDPGSEWKSKYEQTAVELENFRRKDTVIAQNVAPKFAEFVVFQVSKQVTDDKPFEDALTAFLKANPEYTTAGSTQPAAGAQGTRQGSTPGKLTEVEEAFYRKNPDLRPK